MRIDPNRMLVLCAVADAGGVVAAGKLLQLSPSGVSQHLAALERETGLSLVDRSRRGGQRRIALTSAGQLLLSHARRLREVMDDADAEVSALTGTVDGPVTLGSFPTVMSRLALPGLAHLSRAHPAVRLRIVEIDGDPALAALHRGDVDVALIEADAARPPNHDGLSAERLIEDAYRIAIPASWPTPITISDLAHRPWIDGPPRSATAEVLQRIRDTTGLAFTGAHSCVEFPAVLALVDVGLGAALVPDLALADRPAQDSRVVDLPGLGGRAIHALTISAGRPRRVVAALLDALRSAARER